MNPNLSRYQFHTEENSIEAHDEHGKLAGFLEWEPHPEGGHAIAGIMTMQGHRRQGLATEMYTRANAHLGQKIAHSDVKTPDGEDWARTVG